MADWKLAPSESQQNGADQAAIEAQGSAWDIGLSDLWTQIWVLGGQIPFAAIALLLTVGALYFTLLQSRRRQQRRVRRHHDGRGVTELPPVTPSER